MNVRPHLPIIRHMVPLRDSMLHRVHIVHAHLRDKQAHKIATVPE